MPPESGVRILFVGDMHLGRLPTQVPTAVLEQGRLVIGDLGPAAAWERIVATAIDAEVHAVALAGDLVEGRNAQFEAYGPLATGVRHLTAAGITVAAVAGNHDTEVLPRLAAEIDSFRLLGRGGTWSHLDIEGTAGQRVRLAGWSFPATHHDDSPLSTAPPEPLPDGSTLGLLHADLDAAVSRYAPVSARDLRARGYQGWFLGHVHKPGETVRDGSPFYLGSVTGLDPSETGLRGPVRVDLAGGELTAVRRLPLAPLRWESCALDCTGLADPAANLATHLLQRVRRLAVDLAGELDHCRALGVRVTLTGEVDDPAALDQARLALDYGSLTTVDEGTVLFVQKVTGQAGARIDLGALAGRDDPAGLLARDILVLEDAQDQRRDDLVAAARRALDQVDQQSVFTPLAGGDPPTDAEIRDHLVAAGRLALARMLALGTRTEEADHAAG